MTPVEFVVVGTPKSLQSKSAAKSAWKARVTAAATAALPTPHLLITSVSRVIVGFFYVTTDLDLNNILKPILDAMNTVVFLDDDQVIDIIAFKRDLSTPYVVTGLSPVLATQLTSPSGASDFVFVRVEDADGGVIP